MAKSKEDKKKQKPILPKKLNKNNYENGTVEIDDSITEEQLKKIRITD